MGALAADLQPVLDRLGEARGPGLFTLVADAGKVTFTGSVGTADLDRPRPIAADDRFRIASIGKIYLASVVLQLVEEGRLSTTDPVRRWVPGFLPDRPITVDHLLTMGQGCPTTCPRFWATHRMWPACSGTTHLRNSWPPRWPYPTTGRPAPGGATATPTTSCSD